MPVQENQVVEISSALHYGMPDNPIPLCLIVNPWQLLLLLQNALTLTVSSMPKLPLHCMYAMIFYAVRISTGKKRQGN